ncbi:MAG TPA: sugar phosphate isomerase/epimerase [Verrucomicrobiae bacterium]
MYSLSTCWNSNRHTDGRAMLEEIRDLGFEYAELSHGIRISLLPGIFEAVAKGVIKISSVHNFCPLPLGYNHPNPNIFKFSAQKETEWSNALKYSIKSLETAAKVKAVAMVLHFGRLPISDEVTDMLSEAIKADDAAKHGDILEAMMIERERVKEAPQSRAIKLVKELAVKAAEMDIKLGLEIREAVDEIPLEGDYPAILNEFPPDTVGYWHDIGHAQIKANLGLIHHRAHLDTVAPRLFGFHIHDVIFPDQDHRAPGTGSIDFKGLASYAAGNKIKVMELNPSVTVDEVKQGFEFLKSVWGPN